MTRATKQDRRTIPHLVALLLALADLAERAAGRSAPVRLFVLWVLARGEAAASDHVVAVTGRLLPEPPSLASAQCDAAAALRLAARFRALAAALAVFAASVEAWTRIDPGHAVRSLRAGSRLFAAPADLSAAIERLDSS